MSRITRDVAIAEGWYEPNERDGTCYCGCGEMTPVAQQSHRKHRHVRGEHLRYITGHNARSKNPFSGRGNGGLTGAEHPAWRGGRRNRRGYVEVWVPKAHPFVAMRSKAGYILEHRLVMAEHLGRPLSSDEVVHHRNRIRHDNRIENLELTTQAQNTMYRNERAQLAERLLAALESRGIDPESVVSGACGI